MFFKNRYFVVNRGVAKNLLMAGQAGGLDWRAELSRGVQRQSCRGGLGAKFQETGDKCVHVDFQNKQNTAWVFLHNISVLLPVK